MDDDDDDIPEPDLGPWREPLNDDEITDDEFYTDTNGRATVGSSRSAAYERWMRLPNHYSLSEYLMNDAERRATAKEMHSRIDPSKLGEISSKQDGPT